MTFRLGHTSDIHLDHLQNEHAFTAFAKHVNDNTLDRLVITGDISNFYKLRYHLEWLDKHIAPPISFVLGNHDFWFSSFDITRKVVSDTCRKSDGHLTYLTARPTPQDLGSACLIGHDGWYDARNGTPETSGFFMNDWRYIHDYAPLQDVITLSREFANKAVAELYESLELAAKHYTHIIIATHMPPWAEAHYYNGFPGTADAHPWYTCKVMGLMLETFASSHPNVNFTVLCGHTHGKCVYRPSFNLTCHVSGVDYGRPQLSEVFEID